MGGFGSSRWQNYIKKNLVEKCFVLKATNFWPNTWEGIRTPDFRHTLEGIGEDCEYLHITYQVRTRGTTHDQEQLVPLESTQPHFGGKRWWFKCSMWKERQICGRRVLKLYRPSYARYFGCRRCHDLTYLSSQEHDSRASFYLSNPDEFSVALNNKKQSAAIAKAAAALLKGVL